MFKILEFFCPACIKIAYTIYMIHAQSHQHENKKTVCLSQFQCSKQIFLIRLFSKGDQYFIYIAIFSDKRNNKLQQRHQTVT